jgi:uncharacterized protein (TIGR00251 family)
MGRTSGDGESAGGGAPVAGEFDRLGMNARGGGVRFAVHARPGSSRSAILGVREGSLDVALQAPPADGAANTELCRLLARALGVRQSNVSIVSGASSRNKLVDVGGLEVQAARAMLRGAKR